MNHADAIGLDDLTTEERNEHTMRIDRMSSLELAKRINEEDHKVPAAVKEVLPEIAAAIDAISLRLRRGGRLIYVGAGTSGRLGVLDAAECPPTYGAPASLVQGVLAGGREAMFDAAEGTEDSFSLGAEDLAKRSVGASDAVVGIAASGRTPYVLGALELARGKGALTVALTCNRRSRIAEFADIVIAPVVGPEVVAGSTRMKAGTAQKLVLNMLSTGAMIKLGKVYGNLMVDVKASNQKLKERARRIVAEATGADRSVCETVLEETQYNAKLAIFMILSKLSLAEARAKLAASGGYLADALEAARK